MNTIEYLHANECVLGSNGKYMTTIGEIKVVSTWLKGSTITLHLSSILRKEQLKQ